MTASPRKTAAAEAVPTPMPFSPGADLDAAHEVAAQTHSGNRHPQGADPDTLILDATVDILTATTCACAPLIPVAQDDRRHPLGNLPP